MNLNGFENTRDLSDKIQDITEGEAISNKLGTNNVNDPDDLDISEYNKGVDFMTYGNYHVQNEGISDMFKKKPKAGRYVEPADENDDLVETHPMIDVTKGTRELNASMPVDKFNQEEVIKLPEPTPEEQAIMDKESELKEKQWQENHKKDRSNTPRRSGVDNRRDIGNKDRSA